MFLFDRAKYFISFEFISFRLNALYVHALVDCIFKSYGKSPTLPVNRCSLYMDNRKVFFVGFIGENALDQSFGSIHKSVGYLHQNLLAISGVHYAFIQTRKMIYYAFNSSCISDEITSWHVSTWIYHSTVRFSLCIFCSKWARFERLNIIWSKLRHFCITRTIEFLIALTTIYI